MLMPAARAFREMPQWNSYFKSATPSLRRVQESVFECFISLDEMKKLHGQVMKRVKPAVDNVRFYWVPVDAVARTLVIGSKMPEPPPEFYIL
jgi:CRISPR-associated protein Cas2